MIAWWCTDDSVRKPRLLQNSFLDALILIFAESWVCTPPSNFRKHFFCEIFEAFHIIILWIIVCSCIQWWVLRVYNTRFFPFKSIENILLTQKWRKKSVANLQNSPLVVYFMSVDRMIPNEPMITALLLGFVSAAICLLIERRSINTRCLWQNAASN